ncbi:MAG: histidine--tRNA ligase [Mycoplasma sp.]|nr:histidine--tRNA ligase [Mycoplasma sp.]
MSNKTISRLRGTIDIYGKYASQFTYIVDLCTKLAKLYGYQYFESPVIEPKCLFVSSVGETSDIVKKEFYEFTDKGDRPVVLRPEGTASVIRAVVENKIINQEIHPIRVYYAEPMFRYERPQSGRLREFHQFGIECIGTNSYMDDVETLIFAYQIINSLGIKHATLSINNIGNFNSRSKWIAALTKYFKKYENNLTSDSINRINSNPLRILDDKIDGKKDFVKKAPKIDDYLTKEEIKYFENILIELKKQKIPFIIDPTMVRGLDYYTNIVFEINSTEPKLAAQSTLLGGGRYNNLLAKLGAKKDEGCIGFACGIERLIEQIELENIKLKTNNIVKVLIAPLDEKCNSMTIYLLIKLRENNISAICNFNSYKIRNHFNLANKTQCEQVIIIGEKELENKKVLVKNQKTLKQVEVDVKKIIDFLKGK